jgi:GTPase SAR1 family protein
MQTVSKTILVIGEQSVGKSDIIIHLRNGSFNLEFYPNYG